MERDEDLAKSIADLVRHTRHDLGWSQDELARRAGVTQTRVSRIERRKVDTVAFGAVDQVMTTCGARWSILRPRTEARVEQREPAHARCNAYLRPHLERLSYIVDQEIEIGDGPARGWIDLLAYQPLVRVLHLAEIKTEARDIGGIQRQIGWYERMAWSAARQRGWRPRFIVTALYLLATVVNDDIVSLNREILAQAFPVRSGDLAAILADPDGTTRPSGWGLAMIDPLSRRAAWLRPTRSDGRRTLAPYRNYADFMGQWRARRSR
jgi:transcriptional regulator with XRE-family HTH domain